MLKNKIVTFILFLIITFSASLIGGLATVTFKEPWYSLLNKPFFNPPDWVFGPVWTDYTGTESGSVPAAFSGFRYRERGGGWDQVLDVQSAATLHAATFSDGACSQ